MAAQYDFIAGFDLSSLSSATQTQIMQAINQLGPLNNIGGVILQAGTSLNATIAEGTGGSPDVTNNPRFARYIWLNSYNAGVAPTPYYYDPLLGNWTLSSIAAGSISNSHISASAAIAVSKLATGTARYLIRTNAAGTAVEFIAPGSIFTANELAVNSLVAGGSDGYLKTSAGVVAWVDNATERAAIQSTISNLAVTKLAAGSNNTLLGTDGSGVVKFDTPGNLLANNSIGLSLLAAGGAASGDVLKFDGSNWIKITPTLDLFSGVAINSGTLYSGGAVSAMAGTRFDIAHGLGSIVPRLVRVVLKNTSGGVATTVNYPSGYEIDIGDFRDTAASPARAMIVSYGATGNISITTRVDYNAGGNIEVIPYGGGAAYANITKSEWTLKVYAWK